MDVKEVYCLMLLIVLRYEWMDGRMVRGMDGWMDGQRWMNTMLTMILISFLTLG